jgi:pimeloyl-ACP methyl ester carboxylesterase
LPFAEVNGTRLYYEVAGERGDPMLMIHGSWGDHNNWSRVVPELSKRFRVVTYDRRGHSKSERAKTRGSAAEDAMDASALLGRLGLAPAHVVGNSFGATITLKLAARQPSDFLSLEVHEPPLFGLLKGDPAEPLALEGQKRAAAVAKTLERGDRGEGARQFVETLAFGPGQWERFTPEMKETFITNADTWLEETKDPAGDVVDLEALSRFRRPALLSHGGRSPPFFIPILEKVAAAVPGSVVQFYPDDGHAPHVSNPVEFVRRVTEFAASASG